MIEYMICLALEGQVSKSSPGAIGIIGVYNTPIGRIVKEVYKDSPAERAGIREGDKILFVNGDRCGKIKGEPGTEVIITISRGSELYEYILKREDRRKWKYFSNKKIKEKKNERNSLPR